MATLDPQAKAMLAVLNELPDVTRFTPQQTRDAQRKRPLPPGPEMQARDHAFSVGESSCSLRVYRPDTGRQAPCLIWLHGGGFVLGSVDGHDGLCRQIAADSGWAVASVEYRLAPEDPFPAGLQDAIAAVRFVSDNGPDLGVDGGILAIGGDSAGANLATVAAGKLAGTIRLCHQLLLYPVADLRTLDTPSYVEFAEGHFLSRAGMAWFRDQYLTDPAEAQDRRVSPLAGPIDSGCPPAHVITAEFDPLRDEGAAYAEALTAAGVRTTYRCYPGMIHGFASMYAFIDVGRQAIREMAEVLNRIAPPRSPS